MIKQYIQTLKITTTSKIILNLEEETLENNIILRDLLSLIDIFIFYNKNKLYDILKNIKEQEDQYQKARNQANKLEKIARDLEKLTKQEYSTTMEQIRSSWTGDSANRYLSKGALLENEMMETVKKLRNVVSSIRSTVTRLEETQKKAQAIINNKNF